MSSPRLRGAISNPPNRFEALHAEPLDIDSPREELAPSTRFFSDRSRSILVRNDSPDLHYQSSINPYRGCEHGCVYCYARPSHEYLGFSAGLDFESRILVKLDAPELLERELRRRSWKPQVVALSGNTDCYQPVEQRLQITRRILGMFLRFRNPLGVITKNALVCRDLDLLRELAALDLVHVVLSIPTLDADLARRMEPRTSTPINRLETIERLVQAGVPAGVNVAPIIPGLTDEEIPTILKAAAERGASSAGAVLLRLPGAVEPLFTSWVERELPDRARKIFNRIRDTRNGALSDARFGYRMSGQGEIARSIADLFRIHARRLGLGDRWGGIGDQALSSARIDPKRSF